jgi:hypothetical protein
MQDMRPEIIYEIPYSKAEPPFKLKQSANAWWMNPYRIGRLIVALELGRSLPDACIYADITHRQYRYFLKIHPEFNLVRNHIVHMTTIKVEDLLQEKIDENPRLAMKYLERTDPQFYGKKWAVIPFCLECQKTVDITKIPPIFGPGFDEVVKQELSKQADQRNSKDKFKVKPEVPKKEESPTAKKLRFALNREEREKAEKIRLEKEKEEKFNQRVKKLIELEKERNTPKVPTDRELLWFTESQERKKRQRRGL